MESVGEIKKLIKTIFIQSQNFVLSKNGFSVVENASFPRNRHQAHSIFSWSFYTRAPHNPFPSRRHPPRSTTRRRSVRLIFSDNPHALVGPARSRMTLFFFQLSFISYYLVTIICCFHMHAHVMH